MAEETVFVNPLLEYTAHVCLMQAWVLYIWNGLAFHEYPHDYDIKIVKYDK